MTNEPDLSTLTKQYRDTKAAFDQARLRLVDGIRTAYGNGTRQADIVREIDHEWTTEYVRKILKGERARRV